MDYRGKDLVIMDSENMWKEKWENLRMDYSNFFKMVRKVRDEIQRDFLKV